KSADVQESSGYAACSALVLLSEGRFGEVLPAAERALEAVAVLGWSSQPAKIGFVAGVEAALALGDTDRAEAFIAPIDAAPRGVMPMYLRAPAARLRAKLSRDS